MNSDSMAGVVERQKNALKRDEAKIEKYALQKEKHDQDIENKKKWKSEQANRRLKEQL